MPGVFIPFFPTQTKTQFNFMKRLLSTALAIVLFAAASQAQSTDEPKGPHGGKRGEMMKELNLTAEQKAKLKSIHEAEKKEMDALKADGKTDADRTARRAIHDKYRSQMDAVFTPEQKAKLQEGRKDMGGNRGAGWNKGEKMGRMNGMADDLNLTAEQKTKVADINNDLRTKMQALRGNTALSTSDKIAQMKQLAEERTTRLKAVLTPEQVAKLNEKHKGRMKKQNANL